MKNLLAQSLQWDPAEAWNGTTFSLSTEGAPLTYTGTVDAGDVVAFGIAVVSAPAGDPDIVINVNGAPFATVDGAMGLPETYQSASIAGGASVTIAAVAAEDPPEDSFVIYAAPDGQSYIVSGDGSSLSNQIDTGVTSGTEVMVDIANGRLFHWSQYGGAAVSPDGGVTWSACTGLPSSGTPSGIVFTGDEYLAFTFFQGIYASGDSLSFSLRRSGIAVRPCVRGDSILANCSPTPNVLLVSTNRGVNFTAYSQSGIGGGGASDVIDHIVDSGTYFLVAARGDDTNLFLMRSPTGISGSWEVLTPPATTTKRAHGMANDQQGHVVMVINEASPTAVGECWYSSDEGGSWTQGPDCPFGAPGTQPDYQRNPMFGIGGYVYMCTSFSGGVNRIYRWKVGEPAWSLVYTAPVTNDVSSITGLVVSAPPATLLLTPLAIEVPVPCEEIGPVSKADVSAFNRTRLHSVRVLPGEKRCLVANFNGAVTPARTIATAEWRMESNVVASMANGQLLSPYRETEVTVTAHLPGVAPIECRATFDNGEVYVQRFMVEVMNGWLLDTPAPSGQLTITLSAP